MSVNKVIIPADQIRTLNEACINLSHQVQSLMHAASNQQNNLRIVSISHHNALHCEHECKSVVLGKVGVTGKLKAFNYNLVAKDQYWGNRHGSVFEIFIQREAGEKISTGQIFCSRHDASPTHTDKPNDHFNENIQAVTNHPIDVHADENIIIFMQGLYAGHTVDITNLHVSLAVDC